MSLKGVVASKQRPGFRRWLSGLCGNGGLMGLTLLLLAGSNAVYAQAACSLASANPIATFGATSSLALAGTMQSTSAQPNGGLRCRGSLLGVIVLNDVLLATLSSANNGKLKGPNGDSIDYRVFADTARQAPLVIGGSYNYYNSYILGLLGILGGASAAMPVYFDTVPASATNVSAGLYTDTLTINWSWSICTGIGVLNACLGRNNGSAVSVIQVELRVLPDCIINAPDINFGAAPLVSGFEPVTQVLSVRCTKGQTYSVGMSQGQHFSGGRRRMASLGNYLYYDLYKGATGTQRWGHLGVDRRSSTQAETQAANHDGVSSQGFVFRGVIDSNQTTPPVGLYTDIVVVDVTF